MRRLYLSICLLPALLMLLFSSATSASAEKPGFLVVAPDRGYLGNKEVEDLYASFSKNNPAALVFVSLSNEFDNEIESAFKEALKALHKEGAREIVVIPLLLSPEDPHLKKAFRLIGYKEGSSVLAPKLRWTIAPAMAEDYRIAQILEERAMALSTNPANERLIVLGYGAMSPEEEKDIEAHFESLIAEARLPFKEVKTLVMYHANADEESKRKNNQILTESFKESGSSDLRPILISFDLGFKHTSMMQLSEAIRSMIQGSPIVYGDKGILPHPNVLRWMNATANRYVKANTNELGVVIMAHGAGFYINQLIEETLLPLRKKFAIETAFGMAEADQLEAAILKLEARGARRILVLRLFENSFTFKESTEYIIGARKEPPTHVHGGLPPRVRASAVISTSGGLDGDPLISEALKQRIIEISQAPEKETVILLGHGAGNDRQNDLWLKNLNARAEYIRKKTPTPFKTIHVATIREDWPEKRDKAVQEIRELIHEGNQDGGRVLVIAARVAGAGPYEKYLKGENYVFSGRGLAPDPKLTQWIEQEINRWKKSMTDMER